jgi:formylglycine-generating enzyme required for sulfatase activity
MKSRIRRPVGRPLILAAIIAAFLAAAAYGQEGRYALVIGNGNYRELSRLVNPVNDARDMADALKSLGFQVDVLADADLPSMEEAVVRLGSRLSISKSSIGFFFYAGHGVQSNGINYLIPADAHIASESFLKTKALAAQEVLDTLQQAHNSVNVVVLDACRDNPFSWARSGTRGLTVVGVQPPGSIIAYATSAGSVAQDGQGRNGVFTAALLKNIRTPGLEIKDAFNRTGAAVQDTTGGAQVPAIYNQYFGNTFLAGAAPAPAAAAAAPAEKPAVTAPKDAGSVAVEVRARGTLYLNGTAMAPLAAGTSTRLNDVEAGRASLEMRYADGKVESRTVQVKKNALVAVSFTHVEERVVPENMVLVEGGTFQMGDTFGDGGSDERPVHPVTVSSFYLGAAPVTQKEWRDMMGTSPSYFKGDDLPVQNVSWIDAVQYCNKLSAAKSLEPCYAFSGSNMICDFSKNGFRLPTEAEWEFAARGGGRSSGLRYSGSNKAEAVAWFGANSGGTPHPVKQKQANELALFDMTGNVWQWCWDRYGRYAAGPQTNPQGASSGDNRVLRGGSWKGAEWSVSHRNDSWAVGGSNDEGFRVAASAP